MPINPAEGLKQYVKTTLGLDDEGVAPLFDGENLTDDALEVLKGKDAERVATLRAPEIALKTELTQTKEALKQQKMRDKREAFEEVERQMREEYGYEDLTKRGKELFDAIIAKERKAASTSDPAKIKLDPMFREMEQQVAKIPELLTAKEQEVISRFQGEQDTRTVLDEAGVIFDAWEPVLPEDATKAAAQKRDFLEKLRGYKYQVTRKDGRTDIVPMKPDGSGRLEDDHGHAIGLKALVETLAGQRFDKRASENKNGAPDPNKVGSSSGAGGGSKYPATMKKAEYLTAMDKATELPTKAERDAEVAALRKVQVTD